MRISANQGMEASAAPMVSHSFPLMKALRATHARRALGGTPSTPMCAGTPSPHQLQQCGAAGGLGRRPMCRKHGT